MVEMYVWCKCVCVWLVGAWEAASQFVQRFKFRMLKEPLQGSEDLYINLQRFLKIITIVSKLLWYSRKYSFFKLGVLN